MERIKKEFYNSSSVIQDNIAEIWEQRNLADINDGVLWYQEANRFSKDLSSRFNVTPVVSAGVISALSPQKEWNHNKVLAEEFFNLTKISISNWRKVRHYTLQKRKALKIYEYKNPYIDEVSQVLNGRKTVNFFNCIQNPLSCDMLCIDRHMIMVALGAEKQKLTVKQYDFLKEEYLKFAQTVKMIPCEMQGILWLTYKRVKKAA